MGRYPWLQSDGSADDFMKLSLNAMLDLWSAFDATIKTIGFPREHWYVGITSDVDACLFRDHCVSRSPGEYVYFKAQTELHARMVARELILSGCRGDDGGGNGSSVCVYAYVITDSTRQ